MLYLGVKDDVRMIQGVAAVALLMCTLCPTYAADDLIKGIAHIVDGDTIEIDRIPIRFYGIDAAEPGQSCKTEDGTEWECGQRAIDVLAAYADKKTVTCKVRKRDVHGRPVATCHQGNINLNALMVDKCLAWAFLKDSADYRALQYFTQRTKCGIWSGYSESPWTYRKRRWEVEERRAPNGCPIKGGVSAAGRIYHMPWSPLYVQTQIDEGKGEKWFCDEGEALEAGWQAPRWR